MGDVSEINSETGSRDVSAEMTPEQLAEVDLGQVAESFAAGYPERRYPAAMIGSSNGALAQLATAMQVPWLPQTVLIPVHRVSDPQRPDQALEFGRRWGPRLLQANPEINLHQMHDAAQDRLMTARMAYFRVKWNTLPQAYARFLTERLAPWPVEQLRQFTSRQPLPRAGQPEELAQAYLFLMRGTFTTGQVITVDGGATLA